MADELGRTELDAVEGSTRAYVAGALGVASARVATFLAGVLSLWLLTRILDTTDFAAYAVAMSVVIMLGYSAGLGLERSMLFRIGAQSPLPPHIAGGRMARRIAITVAALSGCAALAIVFVASPADLPGGDFLARLAPVVPATALSLVLVTWYQANHQVGVSQAMQGLNDLTRSLFLAATWACAWGATGVALGAFAGAAAPFAYLAFRARGRVSPEPSDVGLADVLAGLQFLAMRLSYMGLRHLDVIVMGALGTATGTAQYAVATRLAQFVGSGETLFGPTYAPRVRRHIVTGRTDLAAREYAVARFIAFNGALSFSILLLLGGPQLLRFFGDFGSSFGAFLILVAAHLLTVGTGLHGVFLSMSDHLFVTTLNRVGSVAVFAVALLLLVPRFDGLGAALAMLVATAVHEAAGVLLLRRRAGITALASSDPPILVLCIVALCLVAIGAAPAPAGALALGLGLIGGLLRERALLARLIRDLAGLGFRRD